MMLATATLSLGGVSEAVADASAQETDPLQGEDVSVSLGSVTASFSRATLAFEDGTMRFRGRDWTIEGTESTLTGDTVRVTVDDVSAETYSTVRAAMVETVESNSPLPLVVGLATADVNPDASVRVFASSVERDGQPVGDQITATGRFETVFPEDLRERAEDGRTLDGGAALGPSEWDRIAVQRGDTELVFDNVAINARPPDTDETAREARFELTSDEVTRDGETLVSNFETSGTLTELLQSLPPEDVDGDDTRRLPNEVIVSSRTDEYSDYVFEVTGDLEKLEPDEDTGRAADEVSTRGDRVRVEGTVRTGDDRFAFSGNLNEVDIPSGVTLEIEDR